jgi:hypothetical protein
MLPLLAAAAPFLVDVTITLLRIASTPDSPSRDSLFRVA